MAPAKSAIGLLDAGIPKNKLNICTSAIRTHKFHLNELADHLHAYSVRQYFVGKYGSTIESFATVDELVDDIYREVSGGLFRELNQSIKSGLRVLNYSLGLNGNS